MKPPDTNDSVLDLPCLAEVFEALRRGKHIAARDGELFHALKQHESQHEALFTKLGFKLVHHARDFFLLSRRLELYRALGQNGRFHVHPRRIAGGSGRYCRRYRYDAPFCLQRFATPPWRTLSNLHARGGNYDARRPGCHCSHNGTLRLRAAITTRSDWTSICG